MILAMMYAIKEIAIKPKKHFARITMRIILHLISLPQFIYM